MSAGHDVDGARPHDPGDPTQGSRRTQQLVTSVIALYGRPQPLTVATIVRLLGLLGVEEPAARTALSRLKRRHVLVSDKRGGSSIYVLNPELEETFREGDERIFTPRRARPEDPWVLATFSVPESHRNLRYQIRKILTRRGFGTVSAALWIAPGQVYEGARRELERDGLDHLVEFFSAHSLAQGDLAEKVGAWWDLNDLATRYRQFEAIFRPLLERWRPVTPEERACAEAFADYIDAVTAWRRLPYVDPGLPPECLPPDWPGLAAERLFGELHRLLAEPAARFTRELVRSI
ncbi:PaaX family transcriptional regulator [Saccharopolyspora pogona]|uniref:PaaX family transcriptional regulator n=1 Tax=Saccharopolyspora pogona TaxID=333966 RepID=UPI0016857568|nr:PaaX family transcriptional regulator C-terminal domain-containing protein [Saccharopolyspora pogona]